MPHMCLKMDGCMKPMAYFLMSGALTHSCKMEILFNGRYSGKGKLYSKQSQLIYEGKFQRGEYGGKGILYNEDGAVKYQGKFKYGEIIG